MKDCTNLLSRLKAALATFEVELAREYKEKLGIKYFGALKLIFHQSKNTALTTDPPVTFRSSVFTVLEVNKDAQKSNLIVSTMIWRIKLIIFKRMAVVGF